MRYGARLSILTGAGLLAGCTAEAALDEAAVAGGVTIERLETAAAHPDEWITHGGDYSEGRFSSLDEIDRESVEELGLSWAHDLDLRGGHETTPLVADGVLFVTGPWSVVYALDARTGRRLWTHEPRVPRLKGLQACCDVVNRGAALFEGKVIVGTLDGRLLALDAGSGDVVWEVMTVDPELAYTITGAPRIIDGLAIIGNGGAELGVRGYVTAYDANTGEQAWRTYIVPGDPSLPFESAAMERAAETWSGEWYTAGGGGTAWDAMAYDPDLGLLYIGTGNGSPWSRFLRSPGGGDNLYLSSIIALRPSDGELVWHFQTTPGDHWDYTATQPLVLADLEIEGQLRKTIMQAPKNGFFYVIDRETGAFISAEAYVPVTWASGIDEIGRPIENPEAVWRDERVEVSPAYYGGHNWQPMAFNAETGLMYFPIHELTAFFREQTDWIYDPDGYNYGTADRGVLEGPGFLLAWDPVRQAEAWRVPMASRWNGGVLTTAGGLVLQGAGDGRFVAYGASTGEVLWDVSTGLGIIGSPVTYTLDGRQHVTVVAGWGGSFGKRRAPAGEASEYEQRGRVFTFALGADADWPTLTPRRTEPFVPELDLPTDAASLAEGGRIFAESCERCHGPEGGSAGMYPNLQNTTQDVHDAFHAIVLDGAREPLGMPSFQGVLTAEQVTLIQAYIVDAARRAADGR